MKKTFLLLLFLVGVGYSSALQAEVKLSPLFSSNMVLQQQAQTPIWGTGKPGKTIKITTSWNGKQYVAKADSQGKWEVKLSTPKAGGPYDITISDGKTVKLSNVMIGEVWLCSGQSNMEMPLAGWGKIKNYQTEIANADRYPNIRLLQVEKATSPTPESEITVAGGGWQVCSSTTIPEFSATAYFFGRELNEHENIPIGLIHTSWGGTCIETWTSKEALSTVPALNEKMQMVNSLTGNKEEEEAKFKTQLNEWEQAVMSLDKGYSNQQPIWANKDFNDQEWGTMTFPGNIENQGLNNFDGIVWFRKTIDIPKKWKGKNLTLKLGAVDDNDITYFNGVEIGRTNGYAIDRTYSVPGKLVKEGKAVITVRMTDTGGNGSFAAQPVLLYKDEQPILLGENWKYQASAKMNDLPQAPVNILQNPNIPSFLFNAMLNPLIPYGIKGAIWYQGEANTGQPYLYRDLLPLMITDWRNRWGYEFPFYIVQLANYNDWNDWPGLREAQMQTLHLNNTGLAVTIDIGEAKDIHPKNKQEVGRRLALIARANVYNEKVAYSGPIYETYQIEGNKIRINFKHAENGLKTPNGEAVQGFVIAGVDHQFHPAQAVIEGNTVIVSAPEVPFPIAVRYAWENNPTCNLYNTDNLPASPFRTDDCWYEITYKK